MRLLKRLFELSAAGALLLALLPAAPAHAVTPVAKRFRAYYEQHHGTRVLGYPLTGLVESHGYAAQYFEKGRLEDHRADGSSREWDYMYGRLTAELLERGGQSYVTGTFLTYNALRRYHDPSNLRPAPAGFVAGTTPTVEGMFIPFDSQLRAAPGHVVPDIFWKYINRSELFPGGWLHDIGLPLTGAFAVKARKEGKIREITMQAFERTVLTYDPLNPDEWQVERGNIGADLLRMLPSPNIIEIPAAGARATLPLHIQARVGRPGEQLKVTLRWDSGTRLEQSFAAQQGEDGRGLLIDSVDASPASRPRQPWTQPATLEIRSANGWLLAQQHLTMLHPDDPDADAVQLYWLVNDRVQAEDRHVAKNGPIEAAALEELLWGPSPLNGAGYATALPTPAEVLSSERRTAGWGPRVTLSKFAIRDGVASVELSEELWAIEDDPLRASLVHAQITRTLSQFSSVSDVYITVANAPDIAIEP